MKGCVERGMGSRGGGGGVECRGKGCFLLNWQLRLNAIFLFSIN